MKYFSSFDETIKDFRVEKVPTEASDGKDDIYENRIGQKYSKAANDIYRRLTENGDEEKALLIAQRKFDQYLKDGYGLPSKMCPCTTVYELVGEIRNKTKKNKDD